MEYILFTVFIVSFLVSLFTTKIWISVARKENILVPDVNKFKKTLVPRSGGIAVLFGFLIGVLFYIALSIFYFKRTIHLIEIFALLTTLLIIGFIGLLDDSVGGWKKGLKRWHKPLLTLPAALPLMAIKAGQSEMLLPFIGTVNLGLLYPLFVIPVGVVGASQGFNMLAGLNGLSVGLASIIIFTLGFIAWQLGAPWLAVVSISMVSALLAFLIYNKYPAKVFPGDVLRYPLGAMIACVAILGNMEKAAMILFIPFFIEFFIKMRSKLSLECFVIPQEDGSIKVSKVGSLTHWIVKLLEKVKKKVYEIDVVLTLYIFEIILALIVLLS